MCCFISWIQEFDYDKAKNRIWFLTDKDVFLAEGTKNPKLIKWHDYVGHYGLQGIYDCQGRHRELNKWAGDKDNIYTCYRSRIAIPTKIAKAVRNGKLRNLAKYGGEMKIFEVYANGSIKHLKNKNIEIYCNHNGYLHRLDGPAKIQKRYREKPTSYYYKDGHQYTDLTFKTRWIDNV